jgi:hypothetical protein
MNTCSSCKNPIASNSIECEWCGSKIPQITTPSQKLKDELDLQILELCRNGQMLAAVKLKKDNSDLGLAESKGYVDHLILKNGLKKPKSGCFIATACYGDYEKPEVKEFRKFRDNVLLKHYFGRIFISAYYFISPTFAGLIRKSDYAKTIIRKLFLTPILNLIKLYS